MRPCVAIAPTQCYFQYSDGFPHFLSIILFDNSLIYWCSAMATCIILMFGRIGGVTGSNMVGLFLYDSCEGLMYLNSALIFSKFLLFSSNIECHLRNCRITNTCLLSGSIIVFYFLMKHAKSFWCYLNLLMMIGHTLAEFERTCIYDRIGIGMIQ